jgi:ABC-type transport system substrate-binding protein
MSFGGWAMDYPDPENILHLLYGPNKVPGPNDSNFNSPEYNALFQRMAVLDPGPTRAAVIAKMDEIVQEESPWVLGYYFNEYTVTQPWVRNFRASDMIFNKLKYLSVEPEIKKKHLKKK